MTRLEIAVKLIVSHIAKMNAAPISGEHIQQALDVADALIQQDKERTAKVNAELHKGRAILAATPDEEKSAADLVAELAAPRPLPTTVASSGFTPYRKPSWIRRLFGAL